MGIMAVAVLKQRRSNPTSFICADGTAIPKGTLLTLTEPRTSIAVTASGSVLAGICARDKVADSGIKEVDVFTDGIFDMLCSGSVVLGHAVSAGADVSSVTKAPVAAIGRAILGNSLETGSDNEVVQIEVNVGTGGNAIT